jgi:TatD DNase family protein
MVSSTPTPDLSLEASQRSQLRILLETDAPFMTPSNLYDDPALRGNRLPICHSAMIPWTAKFVAEVANEALMASLGTKGLQSFAWNADKVLSVSRENARKMYGI